MSLVIKIYLKIKAFFPTPSENKVWTVQAFEWVKKENNSIFKIKFVCSGLKEIN